MALPCTSSSSLFFPSLAPSPPSQKQQPHILLLRSPALGRGRSRTPASGPRRPPNLPPEAVVVVSDPRPWREIRALNEEEYGSDEDDADRDEEEDDRSLDLLARFLHNVFQKVFRRVRKAVKSVLPVPISTKLVGFSVDGVLILAFLWILKAFLEVVCTLGSMIFVSILLVRGVWSGFPTYKKSAMLTGSTMMEVLGVAYRLQLDFFASTYQEIIVAFASLTVLDRRLSSIIEPLAPMKLRS